MTDDDRTGYSSTAEADRVAAVLAPSARRDRRRGLFRRRRRRRIRWLRLIAIAIPLSLLALLSFVFGIVLAYAPQLQTDLAQLKVQYSKTQNSVVLSADGKEIGLLTSQNDFFLPPQDIPPMMANAIVAIEDKRFWTEPGVDIRGIARAFVADVFHTGGGVQGASTITEQFVKLALHQESNRTVLEKLREAALAFQLSHLWKKPKILADYLDTAYFGSGAYGVEAAARAYFGNDPASPLYGCGRQPNAGDPASLCVTHLTADEAALLAAAVDAPSTFNFLQDARAATDRRNLVLRDMELQGYLSPAATATAEATSLPPPSDVATPFEETTDRSAGYFVAWVADQLVHHLGYGPKNQNDVYTSGLTIKTTLDSHLQLMAQRSVESVLPCCHGRPAAALVAIRNDNGAVQAMVGGYDYYHNPFNLATEAQRQPGSAWKAFDLAAAIEGGYRSNSPVTSGPFNYSDPNEPAFGTFAVRNDEGGYAYSKIPLWEALAVSDNSVFSRVGLIGADGHPPVGTQNIANLARLFGISTTISINPSMVIGGLNIGVTPLDMAHAYETIANGGRLTTGTLTSYTCVGGYIQRYAWEETAPAKGAQCPGAVGISSISRDGTLITANRTIATQVPGYSRADDQLEISMMRKVLSPIGTAASAAIAGVAAWGKTGTTNNYADAWFIGSTPKVGKVPSMTVAVWVGYPTSDRSMAKAYGGKPVYGGTYPAIIWHAYVQQALRYFATGGALGATRRQAAAKAKSLSSVTGTSTTTTPGGTTAATGTSAPTGSSAPPATGQNGGTPTSSSGATAPATGTSASGHGTTVTSGGGSTLPASNGPATTTPATTTPAVPPSTGTGGGVTAPTGGVSAPAG